MRKNITIEIMNKSELTRRYGCCWNTIARKFNPEKYKKERR